jgi:hypothetical protein
VKLLKIMCIYTVRKMRVNVGFFLRLLAGDTTKIRGKIRVTPPKSRVFASFPGESLTTG